MNGSTETLSLDDYDKCMTINTRSAFVLTQSVLPHLLKTKGNIVNVSSVTGKYLRIYFQNFSICFWQRRVKIKGLSIAHKVS